MMSSLKDRLPHEDGVEVVWMVSKVREIDTGGGIDDEDGSEPNQGKKSNLRV